MNKAAQSLGKLGKGVPKMLTAKERRRRARSLADARKKRWPVKQNATAEGRRGAPYPPAAGSALDSEGKA